MSSSSDISAVCGGGGGGKGDDEDKACTSYDQKIEHCNDASEDRSSMLDAIYSFSKAALSDDELFKDPPPKEDCPLCMQPMPYSISIKKSINKSYQACCGKKLCRGCMLAAEEEMIEGNIKNWCPFCRIPMPSTDGEIVKRMDKRAELNDPCALFNLGRAYSLSAWGLCKDEQKAAKLLNRAADLGQCDAHVRLAEAYRTGEGGVRKDMNKVLYHWKLAAMKGHEMARHLLGMYDPNKRSSMKHFMIAAKSGYVESLKKVGEGYKGGHVTKDEYASTLRAYQVSVNEMESVQRSKTIEIEND